MLNDEIEKKILIKKKFESIDLTCQSRETGYKTELKMYKANHNKL
jgi:hypothetical protein